MKYTTSVFFSLNPIPTFLIEGCPPTPFFLLSSSPFPRFTDWRIPPHPTPMLNYKIPPTQHSIRSPERGVAPGHCAERGNSVKYSPPPPGASHLLRGETEISGISVTVPKSYLARESREATTVKMILISMFPPPSSRGPTWRLRISAGLSDPDPEQHRQLCFKPSTSGLTEVGGEHTGHNPEQQIQDIRI